MVKRGFVLVAMIVGVMLLPLAKAEEAKAAVGARIVNPTYASGVYYSGQGVTSTLRVKNTGTSSDTFWVRYTVRDKAGLVRKVGATSVNLGAGATSGTISRTWTVPDPASPWALTTGAYDADFYLYDSNPDTDPAASLLDQDGQPGAFKAYNFIDQFATFDAERWTKSDHGLGFIREQDPQTEQGCGPIGWATDTLYTTYLNPNNLGLDGAGRLQLKLPAGPSSNPCANLEGGQLESKNFYRYGTYEVRMQIPDAPSSITGFFIYGGDGVAEIDIEAFNESTKNPTNGADSGKVMFTTYAKNPDGSPNLTPTHTTNGEPGNEPPQTLPFDPTTGMHTYRFDFYPGSVKFYADGVLMKQWTDGLPSDKMRIFLNTWYPRWMSQTPPPEDRNLNVAWIRH